MGAEKRKKMQAAKDGTRKGGKPANPGANSVSIGERYVPYFGNFMFGPVLASESIRAAEYARKRAAVLLPSYRVSDFVKKFGTEAEGEALKQGVYNLLGLVYDENGKGYWTRGLARIRQAGLAIPEPPNRYPLPMLQEILEAEYFEREATKFLDNPE